MQAHDRRAAPGRRLAVAANRPGAMENKEALSAYEVAFRRPRSLFAVPLSSGRTGPICGEQRTERAWLPAPLVWTWVRAYRQLHAGNAGLRPATTSFPVRFCLCKALQRSRQKTVAVTSFRSTQSGSKRCAHAETCPALTQVVVSQKKVNAVLPIARQRFQRLSRVGEVRNREEAANVRTFFELRFAENCVRARPACISARFGLLKACESSLKKRSACTMRGAPLLKFAGVLRVALAGSEFLPF